MTDYFVLREVEGVNTFEEVEGTDVPDFTLNEMEC